VRECRARLQTIKGGSSDTELNEFAVNPTYSPGLSGAAMMVTPVANCAIASRKRRSAWADGRGMDIGESWPRLVHRVCELSAQAS
jgi:hypothetical protein